MRGYHSLILTHYGIEENTIDPHYHPVVGGILPILYNHLLSVDVIGRWRPNGLQSTDILATHLLESDQGRVIREALFMLDYDVIQEWLMELIAGFEYPQEALIMPYLGKPVTRATIIGPNTVIVSFI
jgi:hypothetical protein